ncbi:MAG: ATP-binding cassette domain-containing protein [Armatimonadetes bacterium]|nr:ATP-binding cassette domain-containing protein [Armatimonadota bacterium]
MLEVRGLTRRFGGLTAVKNVDLEVSEGQIFGIIGPNGAGKSTLFGMIAGAIVPTSGDVKFLGRSLNGVQPHQACRLGIARTFQLVRPMKELSVLDNCVVGAMAHGASVRQSIPEARRCLDRVGLASYSDHLAGSLSIGNRKRLELARALATKPRLLLLDEVMGGLTTREVEEMVGLIRGIRDDGVTVIFIEHLMRAVMALAGRLAVLHHGEKIAEGPPEEVTKHAGVIEAYLGSEPC